MIVPLLVHAQRNLLERISSFKGPTVPQPHHVKTENTTGKKVGHTQNRNHILLCVMIQSSCVLCALNCLCPPFFHGRWLTELTQATSCSVCGIDPLHGNRTFTKREQKSIYIKIHFHWKVWLDKKLHSLEKCWTESYRIFILQQKNNSDLPKTNNWKQIFLVQNK